MSRGSEILGEWSIYPGHPVTIAYIITQVYPTFEEAFVTPEGNMYCNALADINIPGAGGNVHSALDLLRYLRDGSFSKLAEDRNESIWDAAMYWADNNWYRCDGQGKGGGSFSNRDDWEPHIGNNPCSPKEYYVDRWQRGQDQADKVKPLLKACKAWWTKDD